MSTAKKNKNVIEDSTISAKGDVNIGDKTTINIYGMEATQGELQFAVKLFLSLIALFGLASIAFMFLPDWAKTFPDDFMRSFAAGGFFALSSIILVIFLRSKKQSSLPKKITDEIQNNN
ncbi:MAG: hypothetical protein K9G76_07605 [Bacteroidales bacterium]|nr:hypothetical protein [Bacteroidales bacterium]MCF8405444.1 hypothetical protein [Bacteroidales bacterium]